MKTKFVSNRTNSTITPYQIVKETPTTVTLECDGKQWREQEESGGVAWHDSYEEAKVHLLEQANKSIDFMQHCLQKDVERLKKIIEL